MPTTLREMALTLDLVARTARVVEDAGPSPGAVYMTDEDYDVAIGNVLAHAPPSDVWLFGYGSLLWKPVCEFSESRIATVRGWHRAFCYRVARFRGTRDKPGLMLALDRGGSCKGMIFKLPPDQVSASLRKPALLWEIAVRRGRQHSGISCGTLGLLRRIPQRNCVPIRRTGHSRRIAMATPGASGGKAASHSKLRKFELSRSPCRFG